MQFSQHDCSSALILAILRNIFSHWNLIHIRNSVSDSEVWHYIRSPISLYCRHCNSQICTTTLHLNLNSALPTKLPGISKTQSSLLLRHPTSLSPPTIPTLSPDFYGHHPLHHQEAISHVQGTISKPLFPGIQAVRGHTWPFGLYIWRLMYLPSSPGGRGFVSMGTYAFGLREMLMAM